MKCNANVKIGDVVKICEEGVRRGDWAIGRVVDVFPGQDGVVRVAKVRTFHGYLVRPVAKLVVIVLDKGTEKCIGNGVIDFQLFTRVTKIHF
jgi:hypothetical protein